jgi:hypothetical protein
MFITALALSATAAYYSIAGLVAIFSAAVVPIIVMGGTLEVAKLVVASWLYRNWKEVPVMLKTYFMIALVVLMVLTSMGIFGYLSKAHLDQAVPSGDILAKVSLIDEKINQEKETINAARKTLTQLDSQVDQTIARTANDTTDKGVGRSVAIRKAQAKERASLYAEIQKSQTNITKLNEEKAPISKELRKVEAEVGPIKYIAALIYGDNLDETFLEKAVRVVILMIVSVFDPLAVLMLVAANWSLKHIRKEEEPIPEGWHKEWVPDSEAWPPYEPDFPDVDEVEEKVEWPENESRIEIIGPNGNDGLHYDEITEELVFDKVESDYQEYLNDKEDPIFKIIDQPIPKLDKFIGEYMKDEWVVKPPPQTIEKEVENLQQKSTINVNEIDYDPINKTTYKHK